MNKEYIKLRDSFTIKDGKVVDLTIRLTGDLTTWIVDYYKNPLDSLMHKTINQVLEKVVKHPVNIKSIETKEKED